MKDTKYKILAYFDNQSYQKLFNEVNSDYAENLQILLHNLSLFSYDVLIIGVIIYKENISNIISAIRKITQIPIIILTDTSSLLCMSWKKELIYAGADCVMDINSTTEEVDLQIFSLARRNNKQKITQKQSETMIDKGKLVMDAKDFINIGIFTVIYFVMFFITGMMGYIPIFAVIIPLVLGILGGIPFMLFLTKTGKFGAATIMGTLVSVLCFLMGQSWISIPFGIVFGFLADLIFKAGEYKSWKHTVLGYCVFTEWVIGSMLPMWIMRDTFFEAYRSRGGTDEYINAIMGLTANWMLPVVIVLGIVGGVIGAYLGKAILKKHFVKAGIV